MGYSREQWRFVVDMGVSFALLTACVTVIWTVATSGPRDIADGDSVVSSPARPSGSVPTVSVTGTLSLDGVPTRGKIGAEIAVIEFSDFECPFCRTFSQNSLPQFMDSFVETGKVLYGFLHMPIERLHPNAFSAAVAASCAATQGRFWEVHDELFAKPSLTADVATAVFAARGVDATLIEQCMRHDGPKAVRGDMELARRFDIRGTPSFLIGRLDKTGLVQVTVKASGALSFQDLVEVVGRFD